MQPFTVGSEFAAAQPVRQLAARRHSNHGRGNRFGNIGPLLRKFQRNVLPRLGRTGPPAGEPGAQRVDAIPPAHDAATGAACTFLAWIVT